MSQFFVAMFFVCASVFGQEAALAVVEKISGSVGFYSAEGKQLGEVKVGKNPHEMILSADKRLLYVTDNGMLWMTDPGEGGNTISIIDVASRKKIGVIDLGNYRRPHGIDLDPKSGHLVVTVENPAGLLLIDPVSRKILRKYDVKGKAPHMVLLSPTGESAYVSNSGSATLAAVNLQTGEVKLIPTGTNPQGGIFSHDGRTIYMTDSESDSISIIDVEKQQRVGVIHTGKKPVRIAVTPDGRTLVYALQTGGAVGFADIATKREVAQIALGGPPMSLTMSDDGRLAYAGVQDQDKVSVISVHNRKIIQFFHTPKYAGPDPVLPLR
jgi:YVTN family beta-propeller protein